MVSLIVAWLAYRRSAIDVIVELQVEHFSADPTWWLVTVSVRNRSGMLLTPTQLRLSRPRSARLSGYMGDVAGPRDALQLPEAVRDGPLLKNLGEQDFSRLMSSFAPNGDDDFSFIAFVPKSTSRLLSVDLTVRKNETKRSETFSAQAYLPVT
jgi:hypothetical protein